MKRREFLGVLAGSSFADSYFSPGDAAEKVRRVGYLVPGDPAVPASKGLYDAFVDQLKVRGWQEGRNVEVIARWAKGHIEQMPVLANELTNLNVDVLAGVTAFGAVYAQQATKTIPIVAIAVHDGVAIGLYKSLAVPEGNITGVESLSEIATAKRVEMIKEVVPNFSHLTIVFNPQYPGNMAHFHNCRAAAEGIGVTVEAVEIKSPADFDPALAIIANDRPDALLTILDPVLTIVSSRIGELGLQLRIPTFGEWRDFVVLGQLISYGATLEGMWRRGADYVDRILRGAVPRDLPVEQPTRFVLSINLKTARSINIQISPTLLALADDVIE